MGKLIVIGHKNPDTDSIVSSIVATEYFKNALKLEAKAFRAGEINNETKFILQKFNVEAPELISEIGEGENIVLVDHNEANQISEKIDFSKVNYIIDHHKFSIKTDKPIFCRTEEMGATSSIIAKMFLEKNEKISETNAKLLLAGILSDTLNFTSPTSTEEDKIIAGVLNETAKIDVDNFVAEMFEAKSSLEGISVEEIISLDHKDFEMGKFKVGIGTWETTSPESVNEKQEEIRKALKAKKEKEKQDYLFFLPVDIIKQNSYLYIISEAEKNLAEKVFGGKIENGIMFLEKVVSRKKQIIPQLTEELTK
ncbi:MAG TPA: manganese-dependent inorganic pyrophosphatase [Candidatus Moranbacteria bacterium]|nr:manganese-dependent inorganic pyrophosphatase [Candidatus Moranbacteria bacterium]